jgi:hypothetical protein
VILREGEGGRRVVIDRFRESSLEVAWSGMPSPG